MIAKYTLQTKSHLSQSRSKIEAITNASFLYRSHSAKYPPYVKSWQKRKDIYVAYICANAVETLSRTRSISTYSIFLPSQRQQIFKTNLFVFSDLHLYVLVRILVEKTHIRFLHNHNWLIYFQKWVYFAIFRVDSYISIISTIRYSLIFCLDFKIC